MIKKHLLQKVLETYIENAHDVIKQISIVEFLNGKLTLRNLTLKAQTIQDLYGSFFPCCSEVLACHVEELKLAVPWISLKSTPCAVELHGLLLKLRLRCPVVDGESSKKDDQEELRFWREQSERFASAVARVEENCQQGARQPSLLDKVLGALRVEVSRLQLEIWRPGAQGPVLVGKLLGLQFQPTTPEWQAPGNISETVQEVPALAENRSFVLVKINSLALETACGGALARIEPIIVKTVSKQPAVSPRCVPAMCTSHRTIELGPLLISGSEEPLTILLGVLNDIYVSFGMTDHAGLLIQRFLPVVDSEDAEAEPIRDKEALLKMHRKTLMNFESLVYDTRRASTASTSVSDSEGLASLVEDYEGSRTHASSTQSTGLLDDQVDSDSTSSSGSESFHDAQSECSEAPVDAVKHASQSVNGDRPTEGPVAAAARKTVTLASAELKVTVPQGELVIRLGELRFLADAARPLSPAAKKCCADLFEVPLSTQATPPFGTILMELKLWRAEVFFLAVGKPQGKHVSEEIDSGLIARLAEKEPPPLQLLKRGPGGPIPCSELLAEPMELVVTGLQLQAGKGLDELRAWWGRLRPCLPQLPEPPPPSMPSACMTVQLLQTTFSQEATDESQLTVAGSWPLHITVPMLEVKSTSSLLELPTSTGASFSSGEDFESRTWWQALFVPPPVSHCSQRNLPLLDKGSSPEAQLLVAEQMVKWLRAENEDLRVKASRATSLANSGRGFGQQSERERLNSSSGASCCFAGLLSRWSR